MINVRGILGILFVALGTSSAFSQSVAPIEVWPEELDLETPEALFEVYYRPFNDFFREIDPVGRTFTPVDSIDSATWLELDYNAMNDLGISMNDPDRHYYGVGRYNHDEITYYFVAVPNYYSGWNTRVYACNETGAFTDSLFLASSVPAGGGDMKLYQEGALHFSGADSSLYFCSLSYSIRSTIKSVISVKNSSFIDEIIFRTLYFLE
ncbi:MAG: hypothetical protein ACI837_002090 [Crocinitomicaceae bacterium]|jgi:hypothetical protein